MKELEIFDLALGLGEDWEIEKTDFNIEKRRLDIYLKFKAGRKFECPDCGKNVVYMTQKRKCGDILISFNMKHTYTLKHHEHRVKMMG